MVARAPGKFAGDLYPPRCDQGSSGAACPRYQRRSGAFTQRKAGMAAETLRKYGRSTPPTASAPVNVWVARVRAWLGPRSPAYHQSRRAYARAGLRRCSPGLLHRRCQCPHRSPVRRIRSQLAKIAVAVRAQQRHQGGAVVSLGAHTGIDPKTRCAGRPASRWRQPSRSGPGRRRRAGYGGVNLPEGGPQRPHR